MQILNNPDARKLHRAALRLSLHRIAHRNLNNPWITFALNVMKLLYKKLLFRRWQYKWSVCVQYRHGILRTTFLNTLRIAHKYFDEIYFPILLVTPPRTKHGPFPPNSYCQIHISCSPLCYNPFKSFVFPINSWISGFQ